MNPAVLLRALDRLRAARVLVVGDAMLDRYTEGDAQRVSPEAPIVVLRAEQRRQMLGGAANVANMLRGLGAEAALAAVVGDDEAGAAVRGLLTASGVRGDLLLTDPSRPTTVKERFVGRASGKHSSQMLRVDHESTAPLNASLEAKFVARAAEHLRSFNAVLISDYAKGVCTPGVLRSLITAARHAGVPALVDPKRGGDQAPYRGATALKPNRSETELAAGLRIASPADALVAGRRLCEQLDLEFALITLDRDGMVLAPRDGAGEVIPTRARAVYDITGAGDMVLAALGAFLGGGANLAEAAALANVAAGLEVERYGVAVIPRDEVRAALLAQSHQAAPKVLTAAQAQERLAERRRRGARIVFTNGCFDLLHLGHVTYLQEAASLGDALVVGLNSDASVRRLKGPERPIIDERGRAAMLAALACVDHVVVYDENTPHRLLETLRPDVLVKGGTYAPHEVVGHEIVTAYGGQVRVCGLVEGVSTTNIVAEVRRRGAA